MHKTATEMHKSVIDNNAFWGYNILGDDMRNDLTIKEIIESLVTTYGLEDIDNLKIEELP